MHKKPDTQLEKPSPRRYYLNEPFNGIYLTAREAQTVGHFLHGRTIREAAMAMHISPRTVEFYLNNIKQKLKCRTKKELIRRLIRSGFLGIASADTDRYITL